MAKALREIVDAFHANSREAKQYFTQVIRPKLAECDTLEKLLELISWVDQESCDSEGQMRDKPAEISIPLLMAFRRLEDK